MKYLLAALLLITASPAFAADGVEGYWLTENERAVIEIEACEGSMCGYVYWIIKGGLQLDENNPLQELRSQPICGLQILSDFEKAGEGDWDSGLIYKADDGDTYKANMELQDDGTLRVRGYVGMPMLGKTQIWSPANKADYKACQKP